MKQDVLFQVITKTTTIPSPSAVAWQERLRTAPRSAKRSASKSPQGSRGSAKRSASARTIAFGCTVPVWEVNEEEERDARAFRTNDRPRTAHTSGPSLFSSIQGGRSTGLTSPARSSMVVHNNDLTPRRPLQDHTSSSSFNSLRPLERQLQEDEKALIKDHNINFRPPSLLQGDGALYLRELQNGTALQNQTKIQTERAYVLEREAHELIQEGNYEKALEKIRRAKAVTRSLFMGDHAHNLYVCLLEAEALRGIGQMQTAINVLEKTRQFIERPGAPAPPPSAIPYRVSFYELLGMCYTQTGNSQSAVELLRTAMRMKTDMEHDENIEKHSKKLLPTESAMTLLQYAEALQNSHQYEEAVEVLQNLKTRYEDIHGAESAETAQIYNQLGNALFSLKRYNSSLEFYQKGRVALERTGNLGNSDLATVYCNIGTVHFAEKRFNEAIEMYRKCFILREKVLGTANPLTANVLTLLGHAHIQLAEAKEGGPEHRSVDAILKQAVDFYERALAVRESIWGVQSAQTAEGHTHLGTTLAKQDKYEEAMEQLVTAKNILERLNNSTEYTDELIQIDLLICETVHKLGDSHRALDLMNQLTYRMKSRIDHPNAGNLYNQMGNVLRQHCRDADALTYYIKAKQVYEETCGGGSLQVAPVLNNMGNIYLLKNMYREAFQCYSQAKAIRERLLGAKHVDTASCCVNLGFLYSKQQRVCEALEMFQSAKAVFDEILGLSHPKTKELGHEIALLLRKKRSFCDCRKPK
eukprot:GILK01009221.1.p1 GENE.GILK01009221.1~~GILK01009221.1.p1  ORF type:complete len:755 (+),score=159.48 GILK01009221.1:112-2376(+)